MKIVIADDHAVVRTGFSMILNFQEDMEVVATRWGEAYQKVMEHKPDVLIMDLSMPPGESGLIATSKISESFPETKILILTMYDDEEYLFHVLRNGAKGYILKNAPDEQLLLAVRTVYKGETYVDMKLTTSLVNEFVNHKHSDDVSTNDPFKILSKRELEILPLIAKGYGNKDIL